MSIYCWDLGGKMVVSLHKMLVLPFPLALVTHSLATDYE